MAILRTEMQSSSLFLVQKINYNTYIFINSYTYVRIIQLTSSAALTSAPALTSISTIKTCPLKAP